MYSRNLTGWEAGIIHRETPTSWMKRIQERSEWYSLRHVCFLADTFKDNQAQGKSNSKQYLFSQSRMLGTI